MSIRKAIFSCICLLISSSAWGSVLVHWTSPAVPPAKMLGVSGLVVSWDGGISPVAKMARQRGYRVFAEVSLQQAEGAAEAAAKNGLAGIRSEERRVGKEC